MILKKDIISGNSLNELTFDVCETLLTKGNKVDSRNGETFELCDQEVVLTNPKARHLYLEGRTNNIYATIGEIFWIMAGENKLEPLMNFLLPRAKNYSDDGKTWRGAYGPRLYFYNQIQNVLDIFKQDGPNTRRAVMNIWSAEQDTHTALKDKYGLDQSKDIPCNNFIYFWVRDNKLNMKVTVRSNDCLFGMSGINIPEWTFLQECVLSLLKNQDSDVFKNLTLGYFSNNIISLHLYEETSKQGKEIVKNKEMNKQRSVNNEVLPITLGHINNQVEMQNFFHELYYHLCEQINGNLNYTVNSIFKQYGVPTQNNQLYDYAYLLQCYIDEKLEEVSHRPLPHLSGDLASAVICNKFTPPSWVMNKEK
jgi:thymidylate synthase